VGETVFVTTEEASKYVGEKRKELSMIFHFEHMAVDTINNKWFIRKYRLHRLKKALSKWQYDLSGKKYPDDGPGWNALYFENHDQPRSVSRFGDDQVYWRESATMLATMLYFQQGTPYIFQGQEIGMKNAHFTRLDQYKDIETHNIYKIGRNTLHFPHHVMMRKIKYMSRDNARTPMQWDDSTFGGFSTTSPWIEVNPNKDQINVCSQMKDRHSIWSYYKDIIQLRKEHDVIVMGEFIEHFKHRKNIYCYERLYQNEQLIIICNGTSKKSTIDLSNLMKHNEYQCLLSNYEVGIVENRFELRPFEARVYIKK
jgi:oligo-1,6-glucosidase